MGPRPQNRRGALLALAGVFLALAERVPLAGARAGTMTFCGRKPDS